MTFFIDSWDSGQFGATWDSGLQWDVNVGPSLGDVTAYLDLVTSEHRDRPNFISFLTGVISGPSDLVVNLALMPLMYDLDVAAGEQLDRVGQWIGVTRNVSVPLTGVYFSLDSDTQGLDFGSMQGPSDPTSGLIVLPDSAYRTLLRATIASNHWDGSIPQAYTIWDTVFAGTGSGILIIDLENMHMIMALTGPIPDALTFAMFTSGLLDLRPDGVIIDAYLTPGEDNAPYFGLDIENAFVAGLDVGAFGVETPGS